MATPQKPNALLPDPQLSFDPRGNAVIRLVQDDGVSVASVNMTQLVKGVMDRLFALPFDNGKVS